MATKPSAGQSGALGGLTELKHRLLFVFFGLLVYRFGAHIPVPGLDPERLQFIFSQHENTFLGWVNMFSGGALANLTLFAIGIMPYISASIIMQLMSVVSPKLEQIKKEGESGRRKINQYTRYATLFLALFQSFGLARWLASNGTAIDPGFIFYFTTVVTLTTGTMFLMWLGEQITERGIGNGISLIIFAGIVSRLPSAMVQVVEQVKEGQMQGIVLVIILALVAVVTGFVVFVERAQRRIKVNYAQRTQGKRVYAAQTSHLPFKVNMAGVLPPIFASSVILLPGTLAEFFGEGAGMTWLSDIGLALRPGNTLYLVVYTMGIIFFAFFYTALVFNPKDTASNLKKSGAYIPGIRPGEQTAKYIDSVMTRLTLVGAIYITFVCLMPEVLMFRWNIPFYFGGTSLLIVVVVIMDFMAQVQSHMMSHQYDSLMKKANLKGSGFTGMHLPR